MQAVQPVTFTTPDGVERLLRFTLGARKRIEEQFGNLRSALNEHGDTIIADLLYYVMFDEKGNPPDISVEYLRNSLPGDQQSCASLLAVFFEAANQGRVSKNELEAQFLKVIEIAEQEQIGSISMPLEPSASDSANGSSGGASHRPNSTRGRRSSSKHKTEKT